LELLLDERKDLDAQVQERAEDDADGQRLDAQRWTQEHRPRDDRDVVDARRDRSGAESAARVEHARGDRSERKQDR